MDLLKIISEVIVASKCGPLTKIENRLCYKKTEPAEPKIREYVVHN